MSVSFGTTSPDQEAELWRFLSGVFGLTEALPSLRPDAMAWKCFEAHPWGPPTRSYALRTPEGIAAYGCISPVRFDCGGRTIDGMEILDWAAVRRVPAAGLLLFQRCLKETGGTLLAVGGSEGTLRLLPQVKWFTRIDDMHYYARPLRPWRHFRQSAMSARTAARWARNLYWRWIPRLPDAGSWRCRSAAPEEAVFSPSGNFVPLVRTSAWFKYLLRCPIARTDLVILEQGGTARGHALLANARGSVRVADFVVSGEVSQPERIAAFAALLRYVAAQPDAAEVVTASSLGEMCEVYEACGLRSRGACPVHLADPLKQFPPGARLEITMLIGDAFYWYDPAYPFTC
jgi:hypothetical protein